MEHISKILDDIIYMGYRVNRERSPEISVSRWKEIYGDRADTYEVWFQADTILSEVK